MKKVLILVPHQDDEIALCGTFLKGLVEEQYQVFVVYMTNGDYDSRMGYIRLKEALDVMRLYGIPESQVIFMGYANQYAPDSPHIYNAESGQRVASRFGNTQTYGLPEHSEYCCMRRGEHQLYHRENLLNDLREILSGILPDVIMATDVEMHVDHIANSLFLDEVIGILLKQFPKFRPIVYKKQGYNTDWYAAADYTVYNNAATKQNRRYSYVNYETTDYLNPYIRWQDRIRLPIDKSARAADREENIVYKALKLYPSQNPLQYFDSIVNSDNVFWRRRTDSVTYCARITATSGEAAYLNDFKIIDCANITHANGWCPDASVWHPDADDEKPAITFEFEKEMVISEMVIYQEFCPKSEILYSELEFDDGEKLEIDHLEKRKPTVIHFSPRRVKGLKYVIAQCSGRMGNIGISEIEIFEEHSPLLVRIKIMIDDNFVYDYFLSDRLKGKIEVYEYFEDGSAKTVSDLSKYEMVLLDEQGNKKEEYLCGSRLRGEMTEQRLILQMSAKKDKDISDTVILHKTQKELLPDISVTGNENRLLMKWIALEQDYIKLSRYFEIRSVETIAVYGLGEWGIRLINELRDSSVKIKYVVDRNAKKYATCYPLHTPDDDLEEVELMVITVLRYFREIEEAMSFRLQCPIVSIENIIDTLL